MFNICALGNFACFCHWQILFVEKFFVVVAVVVVGVPLAKVSLR